MKSLLLQSACVFHTFFLTFIHSLTNDEKKHQKQFKIFSFLLCIIFIRYINFLKVNFILVNHTKKIVEVCSKFIHFCLLVFEI